MNFYVLVHGGLSLSLGLGLEVPGGIRAKLKQQSEGLVGSGRANGK
jgi:hypothetical protein